MHSPSVGDKDNQMILVKQSSNQDLNLLLEKRNEIHGCWAALKKRDPLPQVESIIEGVRGWKRRWNPGNHLLNQCCFQYCHHFSLRPRFDCAFGLDKLYLAERRASQIQTKVYISEQAPWALCRVVNVRSSTCRAARDRKMIGLRVSQLSGQSVWRSPKCLADLFWQRLG